MSELQFLKDLKTDIEAKIAEIESNQAAVAPVKWEPKGGEWYVTACGGCYKSVSTPDSKRFGVERETQEQAEYAAEWMRKFNRLMCWFEENAPGHEISIEFYGSFVGINFADTQKTIDDLRTKIRDGVVEL